MLYPTCESANPNNDARRQRLPEDQRRSARQRRTSMGSLILSAKRAALVLSFAMAITAFASGTHCDEFQDSYDRTYCYSKLFIESDNELNDVYKALRNMLNRSGQNALKETERRWIKYRKDRCEVSSAVVDVGCSYMVNLERTEFLRDRLRECKQRMCDYSAVGQQSW